MIDRLINMLILSGLLLVVLIVFSALVGVLKIIGEVIGYVF